MFRIFGRRVTPFPPHDYFFRRGMTLFFFQLRSFLLIAALITPGNPFKQERERAADGGAKTRC